MKENKRILVVAHNSFSKVLNNGKTLESMFKDFAKDDIAQVFFSKNEYPDFDFCSNYFKISDTDVLLSLLKGSKECGGVVLNEVSQQVDMQEQEANSSAVSNQETRSSKLFNIAKSKAEYLTLFRDKLWGFNSWKTKEFLNWSKSFNPDLIFYVGGNSGFSHEIACYLAKKLNIPLVVYFTDDYLIYPVNRNLMDYLQRRRMKKFYGETIALSSARFVIGDLMAEEYSKFFGKQFLPIMNSVENKLYVPYIEKKEINFSYFGGLHLNRWKMLVRLAESLSSAKINVYSMQILSEEIQNAFNNAGIVFKGGIAGQKLQDAILNSDVLLHVESDDTYNKSLTRLSVSTKIPEYLMSGRLVLGFGPEEVASMRILSDNKVGVVISSSTSKENLKIELDKIISDYELRKHKGIEGFNYAIENFDNLSISKKFKEKLESII